MAIGEEKNIRYLVRRDKNTKSYPAVKFDPQQQLNDVNELGVS